MKNIVGQAPRGENFYERHALIRKIYRSLDAGSDIFLSAPRRVGKPSVMRYLQNNPGDRYCFVYVLTESVHSTEEFFERLLGELRKAMRRAVCPKHQTKPGICSTGYSTG